MKMDTINYKMIPQKGHRGQKDIRLIRIDWWGDRENAVFVRITLIFVADGIAGIQITFSLILDCSDSDSISWRPGLEGYLTDCFLDDVWRLKIK